MRLKRRTMAALVLTISLSACTPQDLIRIRWAGTPHAEKFVQLAERESGASCNPPRTGNGSGLFQLAGHQDMADALGFTREEVASNCLVNIEIAWRLYQNCGTGPWTPIRVNGKTVWPCTPGR
jgi:hypothetical protein